MATSEKNMEGGTGTARTGRKRKGRQILEYVRESEKKEVRPCGCKHSARPFIVD